MTPYIWFGWLALFLALEIPAIFHQVPWTTLSEFAWNLESADPVLKVVFLVGLTVLAYHIVTKWPA